jgi:hypothetical protein
MTDVSKLTMDELVAHLIEHNPSEAPRDLVETLIVRWREVRQARLDAEKVAQKLQDKETAFKSFLLETFHEQKLEGMLIGGRSTGLSSKTVPIVADKEKLLAYIKKTGELDLLQFRLSNKAVDDRRDNGVAVPGTEYKDVYDLFDRKI